MESMPLDCAKRMLANIADLSSGLAGPKALRQNKQDLVMIELVVMANVPTYIGRGSDAQKKKQSVTDRPTDRPTKQPTDFRFERDDFRPDLGP